MMDKCWMTLPRFTPEYKNGVDSFLDFAFQNSSLHNKILCPCLRCVNAVLRTKDEVKEHLIVWGFMKGYTYWIAHGELTFTSRSSSNITEPCTSSENMDGLVHDDFGIQMDVDASNDDGMQMPNLEAKNFYQLIDDSQQELYPGCKSFTSLSFILRLLHLKCLGKWSNKHFTMLLDLLRLSYPEGVQLPKTYYEAEKLMKELGLGYDKIDACPNNCTFYWREKARWKSCPTCQHPGWVISDTDTDGSNKKIAHKTLWHFPLKPRLQRLFMSSKTSSFMRWHDEGRINDGCMRHPVDTPVWKTFDYHNRSFFQR